MSLRSTIKATFRSLLRKQELSPDRARREARLELGGSEQVKERAREERAGASIDTFFQDVQYAFRTLRKDIGFSVIAVSILAIGIGANTALFNTINTALLRQIPFEEPDRLVLGRKTIEGRLSGPVSTPDYFDYRKLSRSFEDLAQFSDYTHQITITGGTRPELVQAMFVTWNLFPVLRANPAAGRHLLAEDEQGRSKVILISHGFWQRRFGGSTDAVGSTLNLDGSPYTVVGVMPRAFRFLHEVDLWTLIDRDDEFDKKRDSHSFNVVGRLKHGVSMEQAQSEVDAVARSLEQQYPDTNKAKGLSLMDLHEAMVSQVRTSLLLLMATTLLVLLIACGNVAGLLLARGHQRLSEMAMRSALGAPRRRLVRQLLTESIILTMVAGVASIGVAYLFQDLLLRLLPMGDIGIDRPVMDKAALSFALLVSILTGLVVGIVPALRGTVINPAQQLRVGTHASEGRHGTRLRSGLVVFQVAVSIVLLIGSGLLITSLVRLTTVDLGFEPDNLLTGSVRTQRSDHPTPAARVGFFESLLEEIEAQPGVVSATLINKLPILNPGQDWPIWHADEPRPPSRDCFFGMARWTVPGYFETMRIPLLQGRDISATDVLDSPKVVVISERVVKSLFPERDPVGRLVKIGWSDEPYQVIGVVADARLNRLQNDPVAALYMASAQAGPASAQIAVRTAGDPTLLVGPIENLLRQKDANAVLTDPGSMSAAVDDALGDFRIVILSLSIFSGVALVLTAIGLYGVIAYHVSQRMSELGIRLAMGASNATLLGMILKRGMVLVGIGLILGAVGAYSGSLLIRQLMFETQPLDATAYSGAIGLLGLVALAACILPAWRATRVNLVDVLRSE